MSEVKSDTTNDFHGPGCLASAETRQRYRAAAAETARLLAKPKPTPQEAMDLLAMYDVPTPALEIVARALFSVTKRMRHQHYMAKAIAFEESYLAEHGRRPSIKAVSMHVYGRDTQRKKIAAWRRNSPKYRARILAKAKQV